MVQRGRRGPVGVLYGGSVVVGMVGWVIAGEPGFWPLGLAPSNYPGNWPGNWPGNYPGNLPGNVPGNLPGNVPGNYVPTASYGLGLSDDGVVVVGSFTGWGRTEAFRWTADAGMVALSRPPGEALALGVSGDGRVVVGWVSGGVDGPTSASKWIDASLAVLPSGVASNTVNAAAFAATFDGQQVVGYRDATGAAPVAMRWTAATPQALSTLRFTSVAYGVSGDGSTAAGALFNGPGFSGPFAATVWNPAGGASYFGLLHSGAYGISRDGTTIVGFADDGAHAAVWNANGTVKFVSPSGAFRAAKGAADAGSVVVGSGDNGAVVYTPGDGVRLLSDVIAGRLGPAAAGWDLRSAEGVTPDGRSIVGWGINPAGMPEGFVVTFCPCAADFDGSGGTPDLTDITLYFDAWLQGTAPADTDCSGGTPDTSDITEFFGQWLAGGC